jgi:hypothetical protein
MKPSKRRLSVEHLLVCAGLVAGFFLLWIDWWFIELSGYQIPMSPGDVVKFLGHLGDLADEVNAEEKAGALWALYLIPAGAVISAIAEIASWRANRRSGRMARFIAPLCFLGAIAIILGYYLSLATWVKDFIDWLLSSDPEDQFDLRDDIPWDLLGPGLYVTVISFVLSFVTTLTVRAPRGRGRQVEPDSPDEPAGPISIRPEALAAQPALTTSS